MSDALYLELITPAQARATLQARLFPWLKDRLEQGLCVSLRAMELEDARSLKQNAFMWGFVLKHLSEQAKLNGIGADPEGWHYWAKKRILGYKHTKVKVPGSRRAVTRRELRSTADLSVKAMGKYLDELQAIAVTEFGVMYPAENWESWRPE